VLLIFYSSLNTRQIAHNLRSNKFEFHLKNVKL